MAELVKSYFNCIVVHFIENIKTQVPIDILIKNEVLWSCKKDTVSKLNRKTLPSLYDDIHKSQILWNWPF